MPFNNNLLCLCAIVSGLLAALILSPSVSAHTRSQAFLSLDAAAGKITLDVSIDARELSRLPALPGMTGISLTTAFAKHLRQSIELKADGAICALEPIPEPAFAPMARATLRFRCEPGWKALNIFYRAFIQLARAHFAIVRIRIDGKERGEIVLSKDLNDAAIPRTQPPQATRISTILEYAAIGLGHILEGADHLAFVLGLLLIASTFRGALIAMTGFTLGHSLTLGLGAAGLGASGLATGGLFSIDQGVIEALIPVTIVCVGLEGLRSRQPADSHNPTQWSAVIVLGLVAAAAAATNAGILFSLACMSLLAASAMSRVSNGNSVWRSGFAMAAGFGLIHGLAFASALKELDLSAGYFVTGLLGFNLGVEAGQVLAALPVWAALTLWRTRHPLSFPDGAYALSIMLAAAGAAWLAARLPFAG
jgi:hypothetical protein